MKKPSLPHLSTAGVILLSAGFLISGCATGGNNPMPGSSAVFPDSGTLVVYSAYQATPDFNQRDPYRPAYSDYKILAADGKLWRRVHNDSGTILQDPAQVELPAGTYQVVARKNGGGWVTLPVTIEAGRNTVVRLAS